MGKECEGESGREKEETEGERRKLARGESDGER